MSSLLILIGCHLILVLVWLLLRYRSLITKKIAIGLGTLALMIVACLGYFYEPMLTLFGRSPSFTGRVPIWKFLVNNYVTQKPWFGYGFGNFWNEHFDELLVRFPWGPDHAHNSYLDIILNVGLVGFIFFLIFLIQTISRSICYTAAKKTLFSALNLVTIAAILIAGVFYPILAVSSRYYYWFLVVLFYVVMNPYYLRAPVYQHVWAYLSSLGKK